MDKLQIYQCDGFYLVVEWSCADVFSFRYTLTPWITRMFAVNNLSGKNSDIIRLVLSFKLFPQDFLIDSRTFDLGTLQGLKEYLNVFETMQFVHKKKYY